MIERERRRRFRPGWAGLAVLLVVVGAGFFERRVSAYQVGVTGTVSFDDDF